MSKNELNISENNGQINISHGGPQNVSQTVNLGKLDEEDPKRQLVEVLEKIVKELEKTESLPPEKKEEALYDLEEASSKVSADQMSANFLSILNTKLQNLSGLLAGSEAVCQLINTAVSILEKIKG
ncbi:hypothetical protein H1R82_09960 [Thermoactinomyces intermedius]|jgi:hypothetical protein|uniref:Uncharacterized protein n=1 Tax=Thermoactinomyces intermedius TaxID=2024 RepID=A0A8I1ACK7_THEIN|nr:hypothetical protein [Thermoactinomyces intermedius]MBA4549515.1 hypothetical protein [Thermoactinomyces intermedius]MBA4836948.1 hypothetical protein [Thermoactinomyces intermedius]MBH8594879.1 hypothetical protein [Thermoactinomyces intermedius]